MAAIQALTQSEQSFMKFFPQSNRSRLLLLFSLFAVLVVAWPLGWYAWWPRQKAWQAVEQRDYQTAKAWIQQAGRFEPQSAQTEWLFGRIERKLGNSEEALRHLRASKLLKGDSDLIRREELLLQAQSGAIESILRDLDKLLINHSEDGAEICEAYVNGLLINGQVDTAATIIQQWQQAFPNDPQPDYLSGRIAEFKRHTNDAEKHFRAALVKGPRHIPSLFALGRTHIQANRWEDALAIYQQCSNSTNLGPAQLRMAQCLKELGRQPEALTLLRDAAAIPHEKFLEAQRLLGESTEYDTLHLELGIIEAALGNSDAAVTAIEKAVAYNPKHRQARYQLAQALNAVGRASEAKPHFEWYLEMEKKIDERDRQHDIVERMPNDLDARCRLGALYLETDSEKVGLFWLRGVLAEDPRHQQAHEILADYFEAIASNDSSATPIAKHHRQMSQQYADTPVMAK